MSLNARHDRYRVMPVVTNTDKAGEAYWSRLWSETAMPRAVDPADVSVRNHVRRAFDQHFRSRFLRPGCAGKRLIEVGCARSPWPSYFSSVHGLRVAGLDYSKVGCEQSRELLRRDGVDGEIIHGDLFDPPAECVGAFDYVVSFGVVEHFENSAGVVSAISSLLKPGGRIYTLIPNQVGLMGKVQKVLDRKFFDIHVLLDDSALASAHEAAGLSVLDKGFFLSTNFGVLNHSSYEPGSTGARVRALVRTGFVAASAAVWFGEDRTGRTLRPTRTFSPYAHCIGQS